MIPMTPMQQLVTDQQQEIDELQTERDVLQARVDELEDKVRNGPMNVVRDHPGATGIVAFVVALLFGVLVIVLRTVNFQASAMLVVLAFVSPLVGLAAYFIALHWQAQHELANP